MAHFAPSPVGGQHLHHYMWGIGLLSCVGAVAVRGDEEHRRHPGIAVSHGSGMAMIVDEFALLLDLRDVYWAKQGRISIDVGFGGIAAAGSYFAALPSSASTTTTTTTTDNKAAAQQPKAGASSIANDITSAVS